MWIAGCDKYSWQQCRPSFTLTHWPVFYERKKYQVLSDISISPALWIMAVLWANNGPLCSCCKTLEDLILFPILMILWHIKSGSFHFHSGQKNSPESDTNALIAQTFLWQAKHKECCVNWSLGFRKLTRI